MVSQVVTTSAPPVKTHVQIRQNCSHHESGTSPARFHSVTTTNSTDQTSGQPTEAQFKLIKEAGIQRVINLAPHGVENALKDEAGTLHELGLPYVHIPVDFGDPTDDDFHQFCTAMKEAGDERLWVHCAANMRVSAFIFRYRRDVLGEDPALAEKDLHRIWQPSGVWKRFIAR